MKPAPLLLAFTAVVSAADPTFLLETHSVAPYTRAYLGNGQIGLSTSQLGTPAAECFMSGLYDHAAGDVPRIALVPAWNEVDVYNGRNWLNRATPGDSGLRSYRQTLDMYDGTLRTEYEWSDGNRVVAVRVEDFVSRADPDLGAIKLEITPRFGGRLLVRLALRAWPPPRRYPLDTLQKVENGAVIWYPGHMVARQTHARVRAGGGLLEMVSQPEGTTAVLAQAVALAWPVSLPASVVRRSEGVGEATVEVSFRAQAGRTYAFYKYAELIPSYDGRGLTDAAAERARQSAGRGWPALLDASAAAWHELWRSDVIVQGDPQLQTVIHSMLFYLLGSARANSDFSIPPMGLSTAGYYGHVFWDADTYMFPPLLLLHPDIAAPIVMFRYRTLEAARANAKKNGYTGAMYPWEAGPDGAETTPRFAYQNALYENHVNGDVALAAWQYYLALGDRAWLQKYGFPIIRDTADFWTSRVQYNAQKDRYEIGKVVSVNESLIGVNNDAYTNAAAKKNLELAILAAKTLGAAVNPKWEEVRRKLWLPAKDMLLIDYPLELPVTHQDRMRIATHAVAREPEGAMMGGEFSPILGVELHDRKIIDALLPRTWQPYVRPPFNVLPETPQNGNINFITGAGAFLHQFLFGYSGLRLTEKGLTGKYAPLLPGPVTRIVLRGVRVRGQVRDIAIQDGKLQ